MLSASATPIVLVIATAKAVKKRVYRRHDPEEGRYQCEQQAERFDRQRDRQVRQGHGQYHPHRIAGHYRPDQRQDDGEQRQTGQ
jgi:hypothetical protein